MASNKLLEWKDIASETLNDLIGENINSPAGKYKKLNEKTVLFERNSRD